MKTYSNLLKLRVVTLLAVVLMLSATFNAQAALNTYLVLTMGGEVILGEVTQSGRVGMIEVISWESEIYHPGTVDTPLVHRPIKFVAAMGKATPKIAEAMKRSMSGSAVFRFFQPTISGTGAETNHMTITLDGVTVKSQRILMANNKNPDLSRYETAEEVTLSYTSITILHNPTGNAAILDVPAP